MVFFVCASAIAHEKPELIFSLDLIRHGDRTPLKKIPNINYEWDQGLGQLSPRGMQQEYELGSKLRKKYIDNYPLLPKHYQKDSIKKITFSKFIKAMIFG